MGSVWSVPPDIMETLAYKNVPQIVIDQSVTDQRDSAKNVRKGFMEIRAIVQENVIQGGVNQMDIATPAVQDLLDQTAWNPVQRCAKTAFVFVMQPVCLVEKIGLEANVTAQDTVITILVKLQVYVRTVQSVGMGIFVNLSALRIVTKDVIEKVENVYHVYPVGMVKTVNVSVSALWTVVQPMEFVEIAPLDIMEKNV